MTSVRRFVSAVVVVLAIAAGCGGEEKAAEPRTLPEGLVPTTIPDPTDEANPIQLVEFAAARERFANAGERSLVDDGSLWELRRGSNLIGTVEVAMLDERVDVTSADNRRELIAAVLPGTATTIKVQGISVVRTASDDKVTYLVVGNGLFQLVDIKVGDKVDPQHIISALIKAELPTGHLTVAGEQRRRPL